MQLPTRHRLAVNWMITVNVAPLIDRIVYAINAGYVLTCKNILVSSAWHIWISHINSIVMYILQALAFTTSRTAKLSTLER